MNPSVTISVPKLQPLDAISAQILKADEKTIAGTAFAISRENGLMVTAKHVIRDALGLEDKSQIRRGNDVFVRFSELPGKEEKIYPAQVYDIIDDYEDDILILRLNNPPLPCELEAKLGSAEMSVGTPTDHNFLSWGYRILSPIVGLPAGGKIRGFGSKSGIKMHCKPLIIQSDEIDRGMSGAAVLDREHNLVVGIVKEAWDPANRTSRDQFTNTAIDASILDKMNITVRLEERPWPCTEEEFEIPYVESSEEPTIEENLIKRSLRRAPALVPWVGRERLLTLLNQEWQNHPSKVIGLIGLGGEGKSSIVRQWLSKLISDYRKSEVQSFLWWNFYHEKEIDNFLNEALMHFSHNKINLNIQMEDKVRQLAGILISRKILLILDGFEVLQHRDENKLGKIIDNNLADFLKFCTGDLLQSLVIITSRFPIIDLYNIATFKQQTVDCLSDSEGKELLCKLGVTGLTEAELVKIVEDWGGHALTLTLLAGYFKHGGKPQDFWEEVSSDDESDRYERLHHLLRRYKRILPLPDSTLLKIFSAFRLPVPKSGMISVLKEKTENIESYGFICPVSIMDDETLDWKLGHLTKLYILRFNQDLEEYSTHPLITAYYYDALQKEDQSDVRDVHVRLFKYYLSRAKLSSESESLPFLIEASHHACEAKQCEEAWDEIWNHYGRSQYINLIHRQGAFETITSILQEFFPGQDSLQPPSISNIKARTRILREFGLCQMNLGRLEAAEDYFIRAINQTKEMGSDGYIYTYDGWLSIALLYVNLGKLLEAGNGFQKALYLAQERQDKQREYYALAFLGWFYYLLKNIPKAEEFFERSEGIFREGISQEKDDDIEPIDISPIETEYHYNTAIKRAEFLYHTGKINQAKEIIDTILMEAHDYWLVDRSRCLRLNAELAGRMQYYDMAEKNFNDALQLARKTAQRDVAIEGLAAHGRWAASQNRIEEARKDLGEALGYARQSCYRLYEANIHLALAEAEWIAGDLLKAESEATEALNSSRDMGYKLIQAEAEDFLQRLKNGEQPLIKPTSEMEEPKVSLWLHGWVRQDYGPPPTYEMDWTQFFDRERRKILSQSDWDVDMAPELTRIRGELALRPEGRFIDLRGKLPLSISLAVGAAFPEVAGFRFRTEQITGGISWLWRSDAPPSNRRFKVIEEQGKAGKEILIAFCLTGRVWEEVKDFYHNHPKFKAVVYAEPDCGPGSEALQGAADATALARDAKELLRYKRGEYNASRIHLILFAPATFCLFLGQKLNALGDIVTYERKVKGGYQKSLLLRTG